MNRNVGVNMNRYLFVFVVTLFMQSFVFADQAVASSGCVSTSGINGGCVTCNNSGCSLSGPQAGGDFGNGAIVFDGGVQGAQCTRGVCIPTGAATEGCIGGGLACFTCSTSSGCNLRKISARSLTNGSFGNLNLGSFLGVGDLSGNLDFGGISAGNGLNELFSSLTQLPQNQLTAVLNQNGDLRNLVNANIGNGALGSVGQQLQQQILGVAPSLSNDATDSLRDVLSGGGGGGPIGGNPTSAPSSSTISQYNKTEDGARLGGAVADQINGDTEEINPLKQFDDWPSRYKGLAGSPILFDPKGENVKRKYPELAESTEHQTATGGSDKRPSFAALDLGVDDEIHKSSWGIYQPIGAMQKNFANSEDQRDEFLNRYESALGVAQTTLSFLDQTVASSLHQVQSQIDAEVTNSLLKQANYSLHEMGNPQYAMLHADVDEKLQACLAGKAKGWGDQRIVLDDDMCKRPTKSPLGGCGAMLNGQDSYSACLCCAEKSITINKTVKDGKGYSLVDRIFYGTKIPEKGPQESIDAIDQARNAFRDLYGDVQIVVEGEELKQKYILPASSIPQKISQLRDGPEEKTQKGKNKCKIPRGNTGSELVCPITGQIVKHGICPSIANVMVGLRDPSKVPDFDENVIEASFGTMLGAAAYERMRMMAGVRFDDLQAGWFPKESEGQGLFRRWLNTFCDASAYAALNKLHVSMKSIVYDHLQLNSKATPEEKAQILKLMDRFSNNFALAEMGVGKEEYLNDMLGGLAVSGSREDLRAMDTSVQMSFANQRPHASNLGGN